MELLAVFIDKSYETQLRPGELSLFPAHNLKTNMIPTIHALKKFDLIYIYIFIVPKYPVSASTML